MRRQTFLLAAALFSSAAPAAANGFKAMAKELSSAARRDGIERVIVLPFVLGGDGDAKEGWTISERLVTQIVEVGKVKALERSFLRKLLEEHRLGETGALDPRSLKRLGKLLSADGIVTGSYLADGGRVIINARLIDVESGVIIGACEREVERDGSDFFAGQPLFVPAPELTVPAPVIVEADDRADLKDSLNEDSCAGAAERVDDLERGVLDLKARYWALQLRRGLNPASLTNNPGSTISDPELKREFYTKLKAWYSQDSVPELSQSEVRRFVQTDGKAYALYTECGI